MKKSVKAERERGRQVRKRGLELVESVPYAVTLRWVFYRLFQEGLYKTKEDYISCAKIIGRARKQFRDGWRPDTLADDTRCRICQTGGYENYEEAVEDLSGTLEAAVELTCDHFYRQERYVEIWFEAKAMIGQFRYYAKGIDLLPFGGDTSIPFKWDIAAHLEGCIARYDLPVTILYFGDADTKGYQIPNSALKDIRAWCDADFEFVHCGLSMEQVRKYGLPENPEKPGQYQWEALSDDGAQEIICGALGRTH